jgi:hypothetical protein
MNADENRTKFLERQGCSPPYSKYHVDGCPRKGIEVVTKAWRCFEFFRLLLNSGQPSKTFSAMGERAPVLVPETGSGGE